MTGGETADADADDAVALGRLLAKIATTLRPSDGDGLDLDRLVRLAPTLVPHASHCAVTLVARGRAHAAAASSPLPMAVDELQHTVGEGPGLDAASGRDGLVLVDDLSTDPRWPRFAQLCVTQTGVRSILSVRLALKEPGRAAISFSATHPAVFADRDISAATVLACLAGSALQIQLLQPEVIQLRTALTTSRLIGAAVGITMSLHHLTYDQAFEQLRQSSQHSNVKLRELAAEVVRSRTPPDAPHNR